MLSLVTEDHKLYLSGLELTSFPVDLLSRHHESSSSTSSSPCSFEDDSTLAPTVSSEDAVTRVLRTLEVLDLSCNQLRSLPADLSHLVSLHTLNLSDNHLSSLSGTVLPPALTTLVLSGNSFASFPLAELLSVAPSHTSLSLSGNKLASLPANLSRLFALTSLQLGSNELTTRSIDVVFPAGLQVLYLGGNLLTELPETVGLLARLRVLSVHDNLLSRLPATMVQLTDLEVLNLHRNRLTLLPVELLALRQLRQLSVRQNPLVTNFAASYHQHLPTLQELAGRVVKKHRLDEGQEARLPLGVKQFLEGSHECLGCGGSYFGDSGVSRVEFVDMCGSFRVPFLQYICSDACHNHNHGQPQMSRHGKLARLRKVLLDKYAPSKSLSLEDITRELAEREEELDALV